MNGRPRQVYMNKEIEKKALEVCEREEMSMSALIRLALEAYIEGKELEESKCQSVTTG